MSQGNTQYPIQTFLRSFIHPFDSCRTDFVEELGYRDLSIGRFRLDAWLDRGEGYDLFLTQVAALLPDHADELESALIQTAEIKAAEGDRGWRERCRHEDASFIPYIHVQGEKSVPSGITTFGLSGGHSRWTTIQVPPKILWLPLEEQLKALPEMMKAFLEEYGGMCPFFGLVTKFLYVRFGDYHVFDKSVQFVERVEGQFRRGRAEVTLS